MLGTYSSQSQCVCLFVSYRSACFFIYTYNTSVFSLFFLSLQLSNFFRLGNTALFLLGGGGGGGGGAVSFVG